MNSFNFDEYKNLKTPESWIDNAVMIPDVTKKPKRFPLKLSIISTAASVVLVTAVILTLSIQTGNKLPAPGDSVVIHAIEETSPSTEPSVTGTSRNQDKVKPVQAASQPGNAEPGNKPQAAEIFVNGTEPENGVSYSAGASRKVKSGTNETKPAEKPKPMRETKPDTNSDTTTAAEPENTQPDENTVPAETPPEEPVPTEYDDDKVFGGNISVSYNSGNRMFYSDNAYFHITQDGTEFSEKYSEAERATVTAVGASDGSEIIKQAVINPKDKGIHLNNNESYTIEIYNDTGCSQKFTIYIHN